MKALKLTIQDIARRERNEDLFGGEDNCIICGRPLSMHKNYVHYTCAQTARS